jgi:hypothetical protein
VLKTESGGPPLIGLRRLLLSMRTGSKPVLVPFAPVLVTVLGGGSGPATPQEDAHSGALSALQRARRAPLNVVVTRS